MNIRALKDLHKGETVYVVASGASVDRIGREFFVGLTVVAVNEMWEHVPATYALMHHHESAQRAIDDGQTVVTSERDWGGPGWGKPAAMTGDYYTYVTGENMRSLTPTIDIEALMRDASDSLVVSPSTTAEALQFAAHLGAATIICCGIDGAALDGQWCVRGYNGGAQTNPQHVRLTRAINQQTINALRARGFRVISISPFVGADHEGHRFTAPPDLQGRALLTELSSVNWQVGHKQIAMSDRGNL